MRRALPVRRLRLRRVRQRRSPLLLLRRPDELATQPCVPHALSAASAGRGSPAVPEQRARAAWSSRPPPRPSTLPTARPDADLTSSPQIPYTDLTSRVRTERSEEH